MKATGDGKGKITFTVDLEDATQLLRSAERGVEFLEVKGLEHTNHYKKAVAFLESVNTAFTN